MRRYVTVQTGSHLRQDAAIQRWALSPFQTQRPTPLMLQG
jgi:hypothetical protein